MKTKKQNVKVFTFAPEKSGVLCKSEDGKHGIIGVNKEEARYHIRESMRERGIKAVFR